MGFIYFQEFLMFSIFKRKTKIELTVIEIIEKLEAVQVQWSALLIETNGKKRRLLVPDEVSKALLKQLLPVFYEYYPNHPQCYSYTRNVSYRQMVCLHKENRFLLKLDIKNFYPSIAEEEVKQILSAKLSKNTVGRLLWFLYLPDEGLPVGSPVSPYLSNMILYDLDRYLNDIAISKEVVYSRYGDDLFFSSSEEIHLKQIPETVSAFLSKNYQKLKLNEKKTAFLQAPYKIGGFTVSNEKQVSLKKAFKRELRVLLHKYSLNELEEEEYPSLKGCLIYCMGNDPTHFEHLQKKYVLEMNSILSMTL
jgi:RNA-directed DNA polymerase